MPKPQWIDGVPRKIVLATDLSCRCDRALDRAVLLARQWNAHLIVLHVLDPNENFLERRALEDLPSWRKPADRSRLVEAQIRQDVGEGFDNFSVVIESGNAAEVIGTIVAREQAGLVVTGVARDQTLGRSFLGATVDRLVRRSPTPILVVKSRARRDYAKVVVATDFSDSSLHGLNAAARFFPRAELALFHAFEVPFAGLLDRGDFRDRFSELEREACAEFLAKADLPEGGKSRIKLLLEHGLPDVLLRSLVQSGGADLVVLGSHGRSAAFEVLIGSNAKRLLETVPSDILLVREPKSVEA